MNTMSTWRPAAFKVLFKIRSQVDALVAEGKSTEARRLIRKAYPFGERRHWPYKVWLDEVARQFPGLSRRGPLPGDKETPALPPPGVPLFTDF